MKSAILKNGTSKKQEYYYYKTYETKEEALEQARRLNTEKYRTKIIKGEPQQKPLISNRIQYNLYVTKLRLGTI